MGKHRAPSKPLIAFGPLGSLALTGVLFYGLYSLSFDLAHWIF